MLDKLQKSAYWITGFIFVAFLESFAYCQNVASISLTLLEVSLN